MLDRERASLDMPQHRAYTAHGAKEDDEQMERIAFALHEMCQPLTALQCRLEIGRMTGTADGYQEAVREGLAECGRLMMSVELLREEVLRGLQHQV